MANYYSKIEFIGSGQINARGGPLLFKDPNLSDWITLTDPGHSGLDGRFNNTSILGALNELVDGLVEASGIALAASGVAANNANSVTCYTEAVDTPLFVHDIAHNLGTFGITMQMFDANPASGPGANNIITCWSPLDINTVRVELDVAASGYFVVFGCPTP
tara:strand:- start:621 stop:1103 length:483 start_codon:yes stop_codon:yes gene_type:complete